MSLGAPALTSNQKREPPNGPPFSPTSADNGLSVDTVTGHIVLGQDAGAPGDPAQLLSFRDIPVLGNTVEFRNGPFNSGSPAALAAITDGSNGISFAFTGTQTDASNPVVAHFDVQGGPSLGAFASFNADNGTGLFGVFGQAVNPAYFRNSVGIFASSVTTPDVVLAASQSAPNVAGFIKFSQPILGTDTETYRFLVPVSAVLNFGNTLAQTSTDLNVTVTGAQLGDAVLLGVPNAAVNANSNYSAWVSAANTVTVRFNNYSAAAIDPASATFKVSVIRLLP